MSSFSKTLAGIQSGIDRGDHFGAQIYISRDQIPQLDAALGESRPGTALTPEMLPCWLSAGKPITAAALLQQVEKGLCSLDDPVVRFLPDFWVNGKESITLRHLLTHTGGFRSAEGASTAPTWDEIIARICRSRLEAGWVPGGTAGYHFTVSWFILAEIVQRLSGQPYSDYVRNNIFLPLGMKNCWIGMPEETLAALKSEIAPMFSSEDGKLVPHPTLDRDSEIIRCKPGSGTRGPIRELGYFYEALLRKDPALLSADSILQMTSRQRHGLYDITFKHVIDWGLGVLINDPNGQGESLPYGFGKYAAAETFGHGGSLSSSAFADPKHKLAVAVWFNGQPSDARHQERIRAVCAAIYEDLGLNHL
jgi:CubicO group peptidase (beta-lactamase class C family)